MKGQEEDQGLHASLSGVAAMENHVKGSSNRQLQQRQERPAT